MPLSNIIPIDCTKMSVFTAIVFTFLSIGAKIAYDCAKDRFNGQDLRLNQVDGIMEEFRETLTNERLQLKEIQGTTKTTSAILDRIESQVSDISTTNIEIIKIISTRQSK